MPVVDIIDIDGIELGDYAIRDLVMTLEPISQATQQVRNINATLLDISQPQFHGKYRAVIACTDHESPVFHGVLPGTIVNVTCTPQLGVNKDSLGDDARLQLTMMVQPWSVGRRDWRAETTWQLQLESV